MLDEIPEEARDYLRRIGKKGARKGAAKRWEGHEKMTDEEKRKKRAEYMRQYRQKRKKGK